MTRNDARGTESSAWDALTNPTPLGALGDRLAQRHEGLNTFGATPMSVLVEPSDFRQTRTK